MTITGDALFEAHLRMALEGPGSSSVVVGGRKLRGFFDDGEVDEPDASGMLVKVRRRVLSVATARLGAAPENDTPITIDGTTYQVRDVSRVQDGKVTEIRVAP